MKFGLLGDIHARVKAPEGREDEWFATLLGKLTEAFDWFEAEGVRGVLQPGDFFDTPRPSNYLLSQLIELLASYGGIPIWGVLGQHDTYYHQVDQPSRTPLGVLAASRIIEIVGAAPVVENEVRIFGASWGQEPTRLRRRAKDEAFRILIAHAPVGSKPLFPGHKCTNPSEYAKQHPGFDFILLGDYHYWFDVEAPSCRVVNVGSLMRMRNSKMDRKHEPTVGILDTESMEIEYKQLKVAPASEVFHSMKSSKTAKMPEVLEEFLAKLKDTGSLGVSFLDNLELVVKEQGASNEVRLVLSSILESVGVRENDTKQ